MYYTWKKIKKSYENNKFNLYSPMWNEKFELPDGGSYSISVIQDFCEYIIKKQAVTDNTPIRIYVNKTKYNSI